MDLTTNLLNKDQYEIKQLHKHLLVSASLNDCSMTTTAVSAERCASQSEAKLP
jgi:hypothetical protein